MKSKSSKITFWLCNLKFNCAQKVKSIYNYEKLRVENIDLFIICGNDKQEFNFIQIQYALQVHFTKTHVFNKLNKQLISSLVSVKI